MEQRGISQALAHDHHFEQAGFQALLRAWEMRASELTHPMTGRTALKLPEKLKARIARIAKDTRRSAYSFMIEALEREVEREERMRAFVQEARDSDGAIQAGAQVYRAEDVHAWLERLAQDPKAARPKPCRK